MTKIKSPQHVKLLFEVQDESGAVEIENVWAVPVSEGFRIDNIPFAAREVAYNDVVSAEMDETGALRYSGLNIASGHSTVRLWFADESNVAPVRQHLRGMGCSSELDLSRLVAVDVPPSVPYPNVRAYLDAQETAGILEYEEACLGQGRM